MRWDELNAGLNVWTIPNSKMKGKESHPLPLPTQCINILQRRAENKHPNGFVFPAKTKTSRLGHIAEKTGENSFWRRITRNAGLYSTDKSQNLTVHDLRRSLASWQINNDVDLYTKKINETSMIVEVKTIYFFDSLTRWTSYSAMQKLRGHPSLQLGEICNSITSYQKTN
jgi:integrase